MQRRLRSSRGVGWPVLLALAAALLVGTSTIVAASDGETIHACVSREGAPRIVDDTSECRVRETGVSWSIQGPQGPQGIQGEQGIQGDEGPPGEDAQIPAGMVAFFASPACPTGWTEHVAARGRVIVGVPLGGTLNGTVGTALGDLASPQHTHSVPGTTGTGHHSHQTGGAFGGSVSAEPGGLVGDNVHPPSFGHFHVTFFDGSHVHGVANSDGAQGHLPYLQLRACAVAP